MVATTRAQVDVVVNGLSNLDRLNSKIESVGERFGRLKTALLGLGLAAFGASAIRLADQISDLSAATDISIGKIKEFGDALQEAGGRGDAVDIALTNFSNKLEEARAGSLKAQQAFRNLGVSRQDLANPNVNEILDKTVQGLGQLESASARGAASLDLFGKAGRGADTRTLAENLRSAAGSGDQYAESIKKAAELQDQFDKALKDLRLIFVEAFSPGIQAIVNFNNYLKQMTDSVISVVDIFRALGVVAAAAFATTLALGFVRVIGSIGRGFESLAKLAGVFAGKSIFKATGPHMVALRGIALAISGIGAAILATNALFDDFSDKLGNIFARMVEGLGELAAEVLNFPTDLIATILKLVGVEIKDPVGLGTPIKKLVENARKAREEYEKTAAARKKAVGERPTTPQAGQAQEPVPVDRTALDNQLQAIKKIGEEYDKNLQKQISGVNLERQTIGLGKIATEIRRGQADVEERNREAIDRLKEERAKLNLAETDPEVIAQYDAVIARLTKSLELDKARIAEAINYKNQAEAADRLAVYNANAQFDAQKNIQSLQDQTRRNILPDIQARYEEITNRIRENAEAAIRTEEAELPRGQRLSQQRIDQIYAAMTVQIKEQKTAIDALVASEEQRKFNQFSLRNQQQIQEELNKATDDYNKLFLTPQQRILYDIEASARNRAKAEVDAIEAGRNEKLSLEERRQLQDKYYKEAMSGSDELGKRLLGIREQSRSFAYGWQTAFQEYVDNATNAAQAAERIFAKATQGMEDLIVNFAKTGKFEWKNFVASMAEELLRSQVRQLFANIFSFKAGSTGGGPFSFGNLFAGFFANGGTIPSGKFGVVGERGPELVGGPASVTPMREPQAVTYNINAVDAASFKAMIARDPSFIHAVAMQGSRSIPGRY